jgi:hypothetical protein
VRGLVDDEGLPERPAKVRGGGRRDADDQLDPGFGGRSRLHRAWKDAVELSAASEDLDGVPSSGGLRTVTVEERVGQGYR